VVGIVVTHWDDDHVRGLYELVNECTSAEFYISAALLSDEFEALVELYDEEAGANSGVKGFAGVLRCLRDRGQEPKFLSEHTRLMVGPQDCELIARSPSSATVIDAHVELKRFLYEEAGPGARMFEVNRNHRSIVLHLKMRQAVVLLGSDLQNQPGARGWTAILETGNRYENASIFKVAHHGSEDSDDDRIWSELLESDRRAVVVPWTRGAHPIPTREQLQKLLQRTSALYVSGIPQYVKVHTRNEVRQALEFQGIHMFKDPILTGMIRLRAKGDSKPTQWSVDFFESARVVTPTLAKAFRRQFSRP
jgi:hypothetical protein